MKRKYSPTKDLQLIASRRYKPSFFNSSSYISPQSPSTTSRHHDELGSNQRIKDDYGENITAALSLPITNCELEDKQYDKDALLSLSENLIIEHAARRVDLFFYTMIAYYKSHLYIQRGRTELQHGIGRNARNNVNVTQACHSSFFGGFIDDSARTDQTNTQSNSQSILSNTHFSDSLNATIELPAFVNKLDDELEVTCMGRQKCLSILSRVSCGTIDPVQGLTEFLILMNDNFNDLENNKKLTPHSPAYLSRMSPEATSKIKNILIHLERSGTMVNKWCSETQSINNEYIELLLRLTPEEKMRCKVSDDKRKKIYAVKFNEIRNEILINKKIQRDDDGFYINNAR